MTGRAVLCAALLATLIALPREASSQLIPCGETAQGDKLHLDDVRSQGAEASPTLAPLIQKVGYKLEANLSSLGNRTPLGMSKLRCSARFPNGAADFTPTLCLNLRSEKVLLEVWGAVRTEVDDAGESLNLIEVSVLVVPMVALATPGAPPGVVRFERRHAAGTPMKQVLAQLDTKEALWGLARVAIGMREYGLGRDSSAFDPLCAGVRVLRGLKDADQRARCAPLANHADRISAVARQRMLASGALPEAVAEAANCEVAP